jgi:hypothetical protein
MEQWVKEKPHPKISKKILTIRDRLEPAIPFAGYAWLFDNFTYNLHV